MVPRDGGFRCCLVCALVEASVRVRSRARAHTHTRRGLEDGGEERRKVAELGVDSRTTIRVVTHGDAPSDAPNDAGRVPIHPRSLFSFPSIRLPSRGKRRICLLNFNLS